MSLNSRYSVPECEGGCFQFSIPNQTRSAQTSAIDAANNLFPLVSVYLYVKEKTDKIGSQY